MAWPEIEPTNSHLSYLLLSFFLLFYASFSELIRNRAHLSEPPLATAVGIIFGPQVATVLNPTQWGWEDNIVQEFTRIIVGVQVFATGLDLPAKYMKRHWKSVGVLLGPNMIYGWFVSAAILYFLLKTSFTTALIVAACLTPTDPVLSASVLGEAKFSQRVPKRVRHLLAAESGCNDGTAFPFLYVGLYAAITTSAGQGVQKWFLNIILWQCFVGIAVGIAIGLIANRGLRFSEERGYVQKSTLFVFYFLLAILTVGVGSTLGLDDFLVAFSAGNAFCWDGWFASKTHKMRLPSIIDLLLNSAMFVYFGAIIPWHDYHDKLGAGKLTIAVMLILLLRRLPAVLLLKRLIPDIKSYNEAIFAGHFGPMGVGALFLAMEARAQLETGGSTVLPKPPNESPHKEAIEMVWPVISYVVLWSTMIHGFSALFMSVVGHFSRHPKERDSLLGGEQERLYGMVNEDGTMAGQNEDETSEDLNGDDSEDED